MWSEFFTIDVSLCYKNVFNNMNNWILKIFKKIFFLLVYYYISVYIFHLYYIIIYLNIIDNLIFKDNKFKKKLRKKII